MINVQNRRFCHKSPCLLDKGEAQSIPVRICTQGETSLHAARLSGQGACQLLLRHEPGPKSLLN